MEDLAGRIAAVAQDYSENMKMVSIIGPTDPAIKRIQDVYRKVLYIKAMNYNDLVLIKNHIERYREETDYSGGTVQFDFNPMNNY